MKKIVVGSTNPVKISATLEAFQRVWPDETWEAEGVSVSSGVSDQPMSDEESVQGARTRAKRALEAAPDAVYGIGLEGGLHTVGEHAFQSGWAVVVSRDGEEGVGSSIRMQTPRAIMTLMSEGHELGDAVDIVFASTNAKHKEGFFGAMTNNALTRGSMYRDGVISALSRFLKPDLFL